MRKNSDIPEEVMIAAERIDRGKHPRKIDELDYGSPDTADHEWAKLAACGNPIYLHKESGYGIVLGARDYAAIISPGQLRPQALASATVDRTHIAEQGYSDLFALVDREDPSEWAAKYYDDGGDE